MARAEGVRGLFRGMSYPIYTTALQVGAHSSSGIAATYYCAQLAGEHSDACRRAVGAVVVTSVHDHGQ
jgi:hypothetical protein